ncbi:fimbria/pilus outer membrane usher protein [Paraburkholderia aspalathi]|uniref:fimbria/pilus outer membrane usher protein n=1 Tax=Paraburkholderia aspalathi TaxID=1324617 RepID=UPI0038B7D23C
MREEVKPLMMQSGGDAYRNGKTDGLNAGGSSSPADLPRAAAPIVLADLGASDLPGGYRLHEKDDESAPGADATAVAFNPAFFSGRTVDLTRYERGNPVEPGIYPVELSVNDRHRGRFDIEFRKVDDSDVAKPCFTLVTLEQAGVDIPSFVRRLKDTPALDDVAVDAARNAIAPGTCFALTRVSPLATSTFDDANLTLDLSIPQADMSKTAAGYVDPGRWSSGENVGLFQYNLSSYTSENIHDPSHFASIYLGLQSGVNIGAWRLRQRSSVNWANRSAGSHWQSLETYAQRDITAWRSQLTLGDSYTSGDIFDSFGVRGIQIASDDRMLPDSLRSYAPVVRGVADTNARVSIRQNGNIIYEASVPPGPFEFADLPATGYGGDLDVTVTEADGRSRHFSVPFSSVAQLLRPGIYRFNVTTGQYRDNFLGQRPWVAQATYQRGISNAVTGYVGMLSSSGYGAGLVGIALNTPIGAVAVDVTGAQTQLHGQGTKHGFSSRISYSRLVPGLNTNFSLAAYRYSSPGFYSLRDAIYARDSDDRDVRRSVTDYRARNRFQINVSQPLGQRSQVYVSGSVEDHWGHAGGRDLQFQVGFSSVFKQLTYSISVERSRNSISTDRSWNGVSTDGSRSSDRRTATRVSLNLTIPLGRNTASHHSAFDLLTTTLSHGSGGESSLQTSMSGSTQGEAPVTYGVNALRDITGDSRLAAVGVDGTYRSSVGTYSANASVSNETHQAGFNAQGAVVVHGGGVTLGPPLGPASALIRAKGAKGARVINGQGATIDRFGYAIIPSLTPYRVNTVALDPSGLSDDVELTETSEEVVPRADSMVLVNMATVKGAPVIATTQAADGASLPMGSQLFDESGRAIGAVGQGGVAFLRGLQGSGRVTAKWGAKATEQCVLPYTVPASTGSANAVSVFRIRMHCEPALQASQPNPSDGVK